MPTIGASVVEQRFCNEALALVLAGGRGTRLGELTAEQTKAAIPFGGQYRAVDFALSNCVNSQIRRIALLTQYKSQSLIRHVHRGWGFLHREVGEFVEIWPAQQQDGERWYGGSVDAVYQNIDLLEAADPTYVLVVAGDQIHSLDYSLVAEQHVASNADVTVACVDLPLPEANEFDVAVVRPDLTNRVPRTARRGSPLVVRRRRFVARTDGRLCILAGLPRRSAQRVGEPLAERGFRARFPAGRGSRRDRVRVRMP